MELCIRSQDKTMLVSVDNICALENRIVFIPNRANGRATLGKYKTKKRALEVLDEIQNILNLKDMYKYDRESVLKSWENADEEQVKIVRQQMSVYEMPEDEIWQEE